MRARSWIAVVVVLMVSAACSGGSDDLVSGGDGADGTDGSSDTSFDLGSLGSLGTDGSSDGTGAGDAPAFEELEGLQVRFVNLYWTGGEGQPIDVYFGISPDHGTKVMTLDYGEVSDYVPAQHPTDFYDSGAFVTTYTIAGKTDEASVLMSGTSESVPDAQQLTYVLSTSSTESDGPRLLQQQVVWEKAGPDSYPLTEPPSGKAFLFLVDAGIQGLPDGEGDFVELGREDTCLLTQTADGNGGGAMEVDPGTITVRAYDVNHNCQAGSEATEPVDVTVSEGDQVLVLVYGTAAGDRQLVLAPVA